MQTIKNKPFINIAYEMNNIRIFYLDHEFFCYCVDAENIIPICDKRAKKICSEVLKRTDGCHLINLSFAYPNTIKESKKNKILNICKSKLLTQNILTRMLLLLL